ncbi:MAG: hypothetical protein ACRBB6_11630 [Neptuniibacter sp.]
MPDSPLSTSALAKSLGKTTKQMFAELESLGWIERKEESWKLTAKGEFEGGKYRESQKFGRYIIWPSTVTLHNALSNTDAHLLTATKLAKHFSLTRKRVDQILVEMGWVQSTRKGWVVTPQGESEGGCQRENPNTAVPYVLWPLSIQHHSVFNRQIDELSGRSLFCCDGHEVSCVQEQKIDNWLYLTGLLHAYRRRLPFEEEFQSDFYLPQFHLYIEYWGEGNSPAQLSVKMRKKECIVQAGYKLIELQDEDLDALDEVLPRKLLKFGIEV